MTLDVAGFDLLPAPEAVALLHPVCASSQWASAVVAARPYGSLEAVVTVSDDVLAALPWTEVLDALGAHPQIGDRPAGSGTESAWSRQEQSAATPGDADVDAALVAGNVAYEQRFDHVFLICATGLSRREILRRLQARLGNDERTEHRVVRDELAAIVALRLAKAMG